MQNYRWNTSNSENYCGQLIKQQNVLILKQSNMNEFAYDYVIYVITQFWHKAVFS